MTQQEKIEKLEKELMGWQEVAKGDHWNPYRNIADAWMIVEEMERRGYFWQIKRGHTFSSPGDLLLGIRCSFWSGTDPYQTGTHEAMSIREAICEAALKVLGKNEDQST